jgi:hypothetical protein
MSDFIHLLNIHRVSDVRQIKIHTAEPLVPYPSPFEVAAAIAKFRKYCHVYGVNMDW